MNFQKITFSELLTWYANNSYSLRNYEQAGRDYGRHYDRLRQIQQDIEAEGRRRDIEAKAKQRNNPTQDDGSHDETEPHPHHWPGAVTVHHPNL